jgi:hypothetical protein
MLPDELINHIFSYCQGSTNILVKRYIQHSNDLHTGLGGLFKLNKQYGFKRINVKRLKSAICYRCPVCHIQLWANQYKKNINYQGQRICSKECLLEYESAISLLHLSY